jgi:hypothetical protein
MAGQRQLQHLRLALDGARLIAHPQRAASQPRAAPASLPRSTGLVSLPLAATNLRAAAAETDFKPTLLSTYEPADQYIVLIDDEPLGLPTC